MLTGQPGGWGQLLAAFNLLCRSMQTLHAYKAYAHM